MARRIPLSLIFKCVNLAQCFCKPCLCSHAPSDAEAVFKSSLSEGEREQIMAAMEDSAEKIISSPSRAGEEINALFGQLVGENEGVLSETDRDQAITSLSQRMDISQQEAQYTTPPPVIDHSCRPCCMHQPVGCIASRHCIAESKLGHALVCWQSDRAP